MVARNGSAFYIYAIIYQSSAERETGTRMSFFSDGKMVIINEDRVEER